MNPEMAAVFLNQNYYISVCKKNKQILILNNWELLNYVHILIIKIQTAAN